jgi:hypothetical protein
LAAAEGLPVSAAEGLPVAAANPAINPA